MRKLKLDLDALTVESFDTRADQRSARGTLFAHDDTGTAHTVCWGLTCPSCDPSSPAFCTQGCPNQSGDFEVGGTCNNTCATCGDSCDGWHTCIYDCYTVQYTAAETCANCPSAGEIC